MAKYASSLIITLIIICAKSSVAFAQNILYVDGRTTGSGDGKSWGAAFKAIQEAVSLAATNDEIWVRAGTYLLSSEIQVNTAVGIYGGFVGSETQRSQRNWKTNATIVDGGDSVRCFHVKANATIDGFTITRGNTCCGDGEGGGIFNNSTSLDRLTNIKISNCVFSKNKAVFGGGISNNYASSATITNCEFIGNIASNSGGGIFNNSSTITITNCVFSENKADNNGGGVYNHNAASPTITNCAFSFNSAGNGGAIFNNFNNPTISRCSFFGNEATLQGGGIWNYDSNARIVNCTFAHNKANGLKGGGIYNESFSRPVINNCIIWGNEGEIYNVNPSSPSVTYSNILGGYSGQGNINAVPLFMNEANGDLRLMASSPCIDAGDPASPLDPDGTRADIGAFYFNQGAANPPAAPQNLRAIAGVERVTLTWDANTEPDFLHYRIYGGTTPNPTTKIDSVADANSVMKTITGLTNGTRYYFRMTAVDNSFNESDFSNEISATPSAVDLPPAIPQNLTAIAGDRQVTLNWQANTESDFLRYRIYGGTAPNPTTKIDSVSGAANTSKTISGLTNGTRYYFRLTAVDNSLNESSFSNEVSATPSAADVPPAAPQNVRATAGDRQITLNWNANTETDFLRYRIYGGTAPNPTTKIDSTNSLSATTKTITNLTNGTRYYFRLTAVDNSLQESSFSNEVSATPSAADLPPAAPQNVQASAGIGAVTLTWNANTEPDFLRYRIYSSTNQVTFAKVDSVSGANNTSRTIAGLVNGVTYYFRVTAVDAGALESAPSNIVSARPQADVAAPTLALAASVPNAMINTSVNVLMNASDASGVQSVTLYYRIAGEAAFSNRAMALQNGTRYSANIPASAITNRGAEFYAQASDVFGNVATTPRYPVRVICPNGITAPVAQPNGASANDYRLFSLPLEIDDKTPAGFLAANPSLGSAEAGKYRWYAFERSTGALREYPNFGSVQITPDAGFALLVNLKNVRLKTGSGVTVATTSAYEIALPQGWSLLGNPFNFNVPLDSLRVSVGTFELWRFTGDWEINIAGLEPWQGYAIWMSQAATFSICAGVAGLNSGASFYEVSHNAAENWLIQISTEDGRSANRFNFVGQHEAANDARDAWDLHEPLALETGVGLRLHAAQNDEALKADIRAPSAQGHVWNFTCRVASEEEVLRVAFAGVTSVPPAFEVMLLDNATARAYDLRTQTHLEFAVNEDREKQFTLLAGTAEFVRSRDEIAAAPPNGFVVLENFPNPFNPATQINYVLPEERHVRLEIYNLHGQRVATLVNETQTRGAHTVVWRAESFGSGVYFIKLSAGREVRMRKAVLMK